MGQLSLSQINSLPDALKNSKWTVGFSKFPSISGFTAADVNLRAISMDIPKATIGSIDVTIRENTVRIPGRRTYSSSVTLTLLETVDARTMQFLKQWRELCSEYDTNKVADRSAREATILLYHCNDQWQDVWHWKIERAWLSDFTPPQLADGSSPAAVNIPMVLTYTSFTDNKMV